MHTKPNESSYKKARLKKVPSEERKLGASGDDVIITSREQITKYLRW
jgi:hypothetical protein